MTYLDCRVPTADDNETQRGEMERLSSTADGQWRDRVAARRCLPHGKQKVSFAGSSLFSYLG